MKTRSLKSRTAFTLIEVLVTVGIIVILTAFLVPQVSVLRRKSYIQNTRAFVKSVETALKLYYDQFRDYPPDGFDPVADPGYTYAAGGIQLGNGWPGGATKAFKNTGSLVYFLCLPIVKITIVGSTVPGAVSVRNMRSTRVGPFLTEIRGTNFSVPNFTTNQLRNGAAADMADKVELVDAWGRPLEYDKVTARAGFFDVARFDQSPFTVAGSHWPENAGITGVEETETGAETDCGFIEKLDSVFDPRRKLDATTGCMDRNSVPNPQNAGGFDLWSHGELWTDPTDDVGTWNIN